MATNLQQLAERVTALEAALTEFTARSLPDLDVRLAEESRKILSAFEERLSTISAYLIEQKSADNRASEERYSELRNAIAQLSVDQVAAVGERQGADAGDVISHFREELSLALEARFGLIEERFAAQAKINLEVDAKLSALPKSLEASETTSVIEERLAAEAFNADKRHAALEADFAGLRALMEEITARESYLQSSGVEVLTEQIRILREQVNQRLGVEFDSRLRTWREGLDVDIAAMIERSRFEAVLARSEAEGKLRTDLIDLVAKVESQAGKLTGISRSIESVERELRGLVDRMEEAAQKTDLDALASQLHEAQWTQVEAPIEADPLTLETVDKLASRVESIEGRSRALALQIAALAIEQELPADGSPSISATEASAEEARIVPEGDVPGELPPSGIT